MLTKLLDNVSRYAAWLAGASILVLMLMTVADVAFRKSTGAGIPGTLEYTEVFLVASVYLGVAQSERTGMNVRTSVLTSRLNPRHAQWLRVAGGALCVVTLLALLYATGIRAVDSFQQSEFRFGLVHVTIWPVRIILLLGLVLYFLQFLRSYISEVRGNTPSAASDLTAEAGY
ncbi:TRAP transporter small permease subunit [Ornithinimicrobium cavernae]|uniref:TRAP transporter small permease subunit n=1 Tax=Ornithinimicrobium cavernae TaxID=2666047 RepID=UPI001379ADD2|nr:TRAP transporter small permease subunit [Ornithinimicrobium cavernae]